MRAATLFGTASALAAILSMTVLTSSGPAFSEAKEKLTKKAWVGCSGKYEKSGRPMKMHPQTGAYICAPGKPVMTRHQAFNACRDQMNAFSFMVVKTKKGWLCRYFGP